MIKGYSKIFWGLVIATFNIKFGMIKIFPAFVGFLIIYSGISDIYSESPSEDFKAAKSIALSGAGIYFISEAIAFIAPQYEMANSILIIFGSIVELLMVSKILEGAVDYLNNLDEDILADVFINKQRKYIFFYSISTIILCFVLIFNIQILNATIAIVLIFLRLYVISMINNLKKFHLHKES